MRIAFLGVGATGKSTLARYLSETKGLPINPVGSRSTAKKMGFVGPDGEGRPYDVDRADRVVYEVYASDDPDINPDHWSVPSELRCRNAAVWAMDRYEEDRSTCRPIFQARLQIEKIAWEAEHDEFVTDRTPLDDAAYAMMHCPSIVDDAFLDRAIVAMERYHFVFGCRRSEGQWLNADPAREGDASYYRRLEIVLSGLVSEWPLSPRTGFEGVHGEELEARKRQVTSAIHARLG